LGYGSAGGSNEQPIKNESKFSTQSITLVQNEKKLLEKIKKRQHQEIQKMIEYEIKVETNRQMNEEKIMKQTERQMIREKMIAMKRKEVWNCFDFVK
jgi:hypothetical protein